MGDLQSIKNDFEFWLFQTAEHANFLEALCNDDQDKKTASYFRERFGELVTSLEKIVGEHKYADTINTTWNAIRQWQDFLLDLQDRQKHGHFIGMLYPGLLQHVLQEFQFVIISRDIICRFATMEANTEGVAEYIATMFGKYVRTIESFGPQHNAEEIALVKKLSNPSLDEKKITVVLSEFKKQFEQMAGKRLLHPHGGSNGSNGGSGSGHDEDDSEIEFRQFLQLSEALRPALIEAQKTHKTIVSSELLNHINKEIAWFSSKLEVLSRSL